MEKFNYDWSAFDFFKTLTDSNRLAKSVKMTALRVSGLQQFEDALASMQNTTAFCCICDLSSGYTDLSTTPKTRRVKTVFLAMRHRIDDMAARNAAFEQLREIFRQFMTKLILEKTRLEENRLYVDTRIQFQEIPEYFFSGCACAHFSVAIETMTDLRFNSDEWEE